MASAVTPVPRPRLTPVPPSSADGGIAAMAADVAAVQGASPLLVTVEHGAGQSTLSFILPAGVPVDLFTLGRIARAHGAVVLSVADTDGGSKATLLLARPLRRSSGAVPRASFLSRALAAYAAWRGTTEEER